MRLRCLTWLVVLGLTPVSAGAQTVDEVVARHIEARGGLEKIKGVRSIRMTGRVNAGPGRDALVSREIERPGLIRTELTIQGMTGVYAFDGERGWEVSPFLGHLDAQTMSTESVRQARRQADIEGPLVDWKAKGHQVTLEGREAVDERDTYRLTVTLADGTVRHDFIDAGTFLLVKTESTRLLLGHERDVVTTFDDYREVGGLAFAHAIEATGRGAARRLSIVVDTVELNPTLGKARFRMPETPPQP